MAQSSFVIWDGIRRAVAAHRVGRTHIRACQLLANGQYGPEQDVLLSQLLSPAATLDLTADPRLLIRFRKLENAVWRGAAVPPIVIVAGSRGCPIPNVRIIQ